MIKNKFCIVGIDNDIEDYLYDNQSKYIGLITNYKNKNYKIGKKIGSENKKEWLKIKKKHNPDVYILIDDGAQRKILTDKIFKTNVKNMLFHNSFIDRFVIKNIKKKNGIVIQKLCFISSNVKLGNGVKINIGCQIHHDVKINDYSTIAPGAIILGSVTVGKNSYIGANATIKQGIKIGNNALVGAGSTVIKDVESNEVVAGNPAKKINQ